jgi:hypothetical protein
MIKIYLSHIVGGDDETLKKIERDINTGKLDRSPLSPVQRRQVRDVVAAARHAQRPSRWHRWTHPGWKRVHVCGVVDQVARWLNVSCEQLIHGDME